MMAKKELIPVGILLVITVLLSSCSNTRYLPEGESLYTGFKLKANFKEHVKGTKSVLEEVGSSMRPLPNKRFFGLKLRLWIHNITYKPNDSTGIDHWIDKNAGEPPVLLSSVNIDNNNKKADAILFNSGFFDSYSEYKVLTKNKRSKIEYTINFYKPYVLDTIVNGIDDYVMHSWLMKDTMNTLVLKGDRYSLSNIRAEKSRITEYLKNKGYYFLKSDYFIYELDSNSTTKTINVKLTYNKAAPEKGMKIYSIGDVYVNKNYTVSTDTVNYEPVAYELDTFQVSSSQIKLRDKPVLRSVLLRPGEVYTYKNYNGTLGQLMGMGIYKFVNCKFIESPVEGSNNILDTKIDLTLLPKRTASAEFEVVSKSNNYFGPGINLYWKNRNTFGGAEMLIFNLSTSFETQLSGAFKTLNSFEVTPSVELVFPKFLVPFKVTHFSSFFVPKTHLNVGYSFLKRKDYFDLTSLNVSYGFKWKESLLKSHELYPAAINFVRISNTSAEFQAQLDTNIILQKSFEEQFIAGLKYYYSYNQLLNLEPGSKLYFQGRMETSGNMLSLINSVGKSGSPDPENPYKIAGEVYAQFVKVEADVRYYIPIGKDNKFVSRLYGGVGYAYGNSITLPYISQFFSGGSSGLRAFPARSVGPGSWERLDEGGSFYEQGGDVKLEWNEELRFTISGMLKWALFMDCGNIWLVRENDVVPGGVFSGDFYKELAVGTGAGLRLDAGFFVLRFDMGLPLRKPWLPDGERWVTKEINFSSSSWRRDNLILNLAIGYPF